MENLAWRDSPNPVPRAGDVIVRVRAVGLNHLDVLVPVRGVARAYRELIVLALG